MQMNCFIKRKIENMHNLGLRCKNYKSKARIIYQKQLNLSLNVKILRRSLNEQLMNFPIKRLIRLIKNDRNERNQNQNSSSK